MDAPSLTSLIIPVFNALPFLRQCVESLRKTIRLPYELILINNGSNPETTRYLKSLSNIRLIQNRRNLGFSRAINQGMRISRGEHIVWINSDILLTPYWLEQLLACLKSEKTAGAVGPMTNNSIGAQIDLKLPAELCRIRGAVGAATTRKINQFSAMRSMANHNEYQETRRLAGFCMLLRRAVIESVGFLDERFGLGSYEELDYCLRMRQAGYRLFIARDTFIYHHGHASFRCSDDEYEHIVTRNKAIFFKKWCINSFDFLDHINQDRDFIRSGQILQDSAAPQLARQ